MGLQMQAIGGADVLRSRDRDDVARICNIQEVALSGIALATSDCLSREVFGVLGVPVDALNLSTLVGKIDSAVGNGAPFFVSTPNVNWLMTSRKSHEFREALLLSDICPADGMPIVWIARLLGLPIRTRLAGSDLFDTLKARSRNGRRMRVFLFGGSEDAATQVGEILNAETDSMECVGSLNPGFGSVEEMSTDQIIDEINASGADLLVVFMAAKKAQQWLRLNHDRLKIPVRANLGATVNFQVGKFKRAPLFLRRAGFEWLWRVKEEPYLWRRYWNDGGRLLFVVLTCAVPLAVGARWRRFTSADASEGLQIDHREDHQAVTIGLTGAAIARQVDHAISYFRAALDRNKAVLIDLSKTRVVDPRFFGLFLMVRKQLLSQGNSLQFTGVTPRIKRMFRLNGFEFLL
jgi:N-acetylglucosaminyldiphosphoundecaprenol N-acetyl-beta-D-mannosaminyltransferase